MVDYGLKCWDSGRNLTLDTTERISRVRYQTTATKTESDSIVLADINGKLTMQFAVPIVTPTFGNPGIGHVVRRDGTTIYWRPIPSAVQNSSSVIVVMMYD